jgi:hypothetical protein
MFLPTTGLSRRQNLHPSSAFHRPKKKAFDMNITQ